MDIFYYVGAAAFAILLIFVLIKVLAAPIKGILKLLAHAATGFLMLLAVNLVGGFLNFRVPISLLTVLVAGIGGIPGAILIVLYYLMF